MSEPVLGSTADLELPADVAYLYTAAEGPPLKAHAAALRAYLAARGLGEPGRDRHLAVEQECRVLVARLLGSEAASIAFMANASEALASVAEAIAWEDGDNVVISDLEFPSNVLPWLRLKQRGVEVRVVAGEGWRLDPAALAAAVDGRTRAISVSHVSYLSGARLELAPLRAAADDHGALLIVDATQSAGVVPVPAGVADVVVASSYKWLLGAHGLGIVAVDRARTAALEPPLVGWRAVADMFSPHRFERFAWRPDARRWELAFPSYPALYMLRDSLRWLLALEIERIEAHVLALGDRLIAGLERQGRTVMTPREQAARAGSVAFVAADGAALSAALARAGVLGWGGDGRMRFSLHAFNAAADVERALDALAAVDPDGDGAPEAGR